LNQYPFTKANFNYPRLNRVARKAGRPPLLACKSGVLRNSLQDIAVAWLATA